MEGSVTANLIEHEAEIVSKLEGLGAALAGGVEGSMIIDLIATRSHSSPDAVLRRRAIVSKFLEEGAAEKEKLLATLAKDYEQSPVIDLFQMSRVLRAMLDEGGAAPPPPPPLPSLLPSHPSLVSRSSPTHSTPVWR